MGGQASEVTNAGDRNRYEAVEEFPHAVTPERDLAADALALAQLERSDGLGCLANERLLTGDRRHVTDRPVEQRRLLDSATDTHVHDDLLETRDLHDVADTQLFLEGGTHLVLILDLEARAGRSSRGHQMTSPVRFATRTLVPSVFTR